MLRYLEFLPCLKADLVVILEKFYRMENQASHEDFKVLREYCNLERNHYPVVSIFNQNMEHQNRN